MKGTGPNNKDECWIFKLEILLQIAPVRLLFSIQLLPRKILI